jgi:hypothetical protein
MAPPRGSMTNGFQRVVFPIYGAIGPKKLKVALYKSDERLYKRDEWGKSASIFLLPDTGRPFNRCMTLVRLVR